MIRVGTSEGAVNRVYPPPTDSFTFSVSQCVRTGFPEWTCVCVRLPLHALEIKGMHEGVDKHKERAKIQEQGFLQRGIDMYFTE